MLCGLLANFIGLQRALLVAVLATAHIPSLLAYKHSLKYSRIILPTSATDKPAHMSTEGIQMQDIM